MRIVLAIGSLDIGGSERQLVRLAIELSERGHDVTVLCVTTGDGPLAGDLHDAGVPIWDLDFQGLLARSPSGRIRPVATAKLWWRWLTLVVELRRRRPDVVHAFLFWSYVLVLPAAWLARVPARMSGRRNLGTEKYARPLYPWLERIADACSTHAIANARAVAVVVHDDAGVAWRRIRVINNGIDLPVPADAVDRQPPAGAVIANLIAYKGHVDLVHALATLETPPHVDCYGDGPERPRLEQLIDELGLDGTVTLHGRVPDASRHYRDVQFAVLASHEEGLPNAVLEAMAAGLPVVATRVGGTPELIDDGRTGLLVPPHDPAALGHAIGRVADDTDLRLRLGAAAREDVARRFSWSRCADEHEAVYREACGRVESVSPRRARP